MAPVGLLLLLVAWTLAPLGAATATPRSEESKGPGDPRTLVLGDVVDREGRPVAGLRVRARVWEPREAPAVRAQRPWRLTKTRAGGRFVFEGCESGRSYELAVGSTENGVPWSLERPRVLRAGAAPEPLVALRHGLRILVFDPEGRPVAEGEPRVETLPPQPRDPWGARILVLDAGPGNWRCSVEPDRAYSVVWFDGEHALAEEVVRVPLGTEVKEVELHLAAPQARAGLAVTVRTPEGGRVATQDAEQVRVAVRAPRGDQILAASRRSTPLAPFRFELPAGEYVVETSTIAEEQGLWGCNEPPVYLGYGAVRTPVVLRAGECTELSTTPWRAGRLHVTVLLPDGFESWSDEVLGGDTWLDWISHVRVRVVPREGAPRELSFFLFEPSFEGSEAEGRPHSIAFRTHEPLRPGPYRLVLEAPGCVRAEVAVQIGPGADTPVRVALASEALAGR